MISSGGIQLLAPRRKRKRKGSDNTPRPDEKKYQPDPEQQPNGDEKTPKDVNSFKGLGLSSWLCKNCKEMGFTVPTLIQQKCIPPILQGVDVIGAALTGSGKTAAFGLPILEHLSREPYGIFALVVTPTRELAFQIADQFNALGANFTLKTEVVVGGLDRTAQSLALVQRPHIVVGTPGRLADLLGSSMDISRIKFLVLDEADRLLEEAFAPSLTPILQAAPKSRQTLLFSATMTKSLKKLQKMALGRQTFRFDACPKYSTVETLTQEYLYMPEKVKMCYLVYVLRCFSSCSCIVFTSTQARAQLVSETLKLLKLRVSVLHSYLTQDQRNSNLLAFRSHKSKVLVATDVASRGLDIQRVGLVVNYDIPPTPADYVHRVGRTARAGKQGQSISLVTEYDVERVKKIEDALEVTITEHEAEERDILVHLNESTTAIKLATLKLEEQGFWELSKEKKIAKRMAKGNNTTPKNNKRKTAPYPKKSEKKIKQK